MPLYPFSNVFEDQSLSCGRSRRSSIIVNLYRVYVPVSPFYLGIESCTLGRGAFAKDESVTIIDIVPLLSPNFHETDRNLFLIFFLLRDIVNFFAYRVFFFFIPYFVSEDDRN